MNDRGQVQGWVLIALMTIALGFAIWAVARDQITDLISRWM